MAGPVPPSGAGPDSSIDEAVAALTVVTSRLGSRCFLTLVTLSWCLRVACRRAPWGAACGLPPGAASIAWRVGSKPGQVHLSSSPRGPQPLGPLSISHVIPSRLFQTLNSQRWNCNVLGRSRKMTAGNYVRHYSVRSGSGSPRCGSGSPRAGVWYAVCGARCVVLGAWCSVRGAWCACVVLVWSISAMILVSLNRWALYQFRT